MISVRRPPAPDCLTKSNLREIQKERIRVWFTTPKRYRGGRSFAPRGAHEIPGLVKELRSVFSNKCAFCETELTDEPDEIVLAFFRPTEGALQLNGVIHSDHYWWLSWEWSNLYLACPVCIREKGQNFPTGKSRAKPDSYNEALLLEHPLLLDPCIDDPSQHFLFDESGKVTHVRESKRGMVTIKLLKLNRDDLVHARRTSANKIKDLLYECLQRTTGGVKAELGEKPNMLIHACSASAPFAGMNRQLLMMWLEQLTPIKHPIRPMLRTVQKCISHNASNTGGQQCEESLRLYLDAAKRLRHRLIYRAFLSVDLVDSTKMKEDQDTVTMEYSFRQYNLFLEKILQSHKSVRYTGAGDGSMSCFGTSQNAVNAAIELLKNIGEFNREQNKLPKPFVPRCGVNTGGVFEDESIPLEKMFSPVIDFAGHLQKEAPPNGLLISETTYNEINNTTDFHRAREKVDGEKVWKYGVPGAGSKRSG